MGSLRFVFRFVGAGKSSRYPGVGTVDAESCWPTWRAGLSAMTNTTSPRRLFVVCVFAGVSMARLYCCARHLHQSA